MHNGTIDFKHILSQASILQVQIYVGTFHWVLIFFLFTIAVSMMLIKVHANAWLCTRFQRVKCSVVFTCTTLHLTFLGGGVGSLGKDIRGSVRSVLEHVQSYEVTYPRWLQSHRHRSANQAVSQPVSLSLGSKFELKIIYENMSFFSASL